MTHVRRGDSEMEGVVTGDSERLRMLGSVDSVVFDCDGTLIDVSGSYDATIVRTTLVMLHEFSGMELPLVTAGPELIMRIRRTGGFNNDWDTTYALTLFALVAQDSSRNTQAAMVRLKELVSGFSSEVRTEGALAVDDFLAESGYGNEERIRKLKEFLGYPGTAFSSLLARVFDETYLGKGLFRKVYGMDAVRSDGSGLIEREKLLISRPILAELAKAIDGKRIAMSTGRSSAAAEYTLGPLMDFFERRASVFIGDMDVNPDLAAVLAKYRKPSGASLIHAREELSSSIAIYAGDSAEDRMMVEDARRSQEGFLFAGVFGTAADRMGQREFFIKSGADLVVKSVAQLPGILARMKP